MKDKSNISKDRFLIIILTIIIIYLTVLVGNNKKEIEEIERQKQDLLDEVRVLSKKIDEYSFRLEEANDKIEKSNEMGNAVLRRANTITDDYANGNYWEMNEILKYLVDQFLDIVESHELVDDPT